jgi:outer membrane protein OmpA-like peptidoglycan-associated protein
MAEDWLVDVRKYAANADDKVVGAIVNYLGNTLRDRDSSLVAFTDDEEVGRVRENYLRKKLGLTGTDDVLNKGLGWVKGLMKGDRTKNRVTVYYLLAHYFGKLDLFGGSAGTSAASLGAAAAGIGAATLAGVGDTGATFSTEESSPASAPPAYAANLDDVDEGGSGWPSWLSWLLLALAGLALFFLLRSCMAETPVATTVAPSETNMGIEENVIAEAAVPAGAGVISGVQDNKPMLTVYFDTAKSDVSNDMTAVAATLKAYLDANPGTTLAVSGYNDPSGNAAANAELSKNRAQAVAAALAAAGIAPGSVELVKPEETTSTTVTPEQARRVEVIVK